MRMNSLFYLAPSPGDNFNLSSFGCKTSNIPISLSYYILACIPAKMLKMVIMLYFSSVQPHRAVNLVMDKKKINHKNSK